MTIIIVLSFQCHSQSVRLPILLSVYMSAIIILVFISIAVAGVFLLLFYKAVNTGQYEEFESPAVRALSDDELCSKNEKKITKN